MPLVTERTKENIYALLTEHLPQHDHILAGRAAILEYVNSTLNLRRLDGRLISWPTIYRWSTHYGLPLLPGKASPNPKRRYCAVSSAYCLTAWTIAKSRNGTKALFAIWWPSITHRQAA